MRDFVKALGLVAALLIAAPSVAGCAQLAALTQNEQVATYDEKAMISVEALYGYALDQAKAAATSGVLTANQAAKVSALLAKAKDGVAKARALYDKGVDAEASPKTAEALSAVNAVIAALVELGAIKK